MIFKRLLFHTVFLFCLVLSGFSQGVILKESEKGIHFLKGDQELLVYQTSIADVPEGVDPLYKKSGFIHPLKSPSGQLLTAIQPLDHYHHYGIWGPWTNTTIAGRHVDFWNLADGKGRVDFERVVSKSSKDGIAELIVRQNHMDLLAPDGPQLALEEDLMLRVRQIDEHKYLLDYTTTISTPLESGVLLNEYRYGGGLGYRAVESWDPETSTMLTSEGLSRDEADGAKSRWIIVEGETDNQSGRSGILFLSHVENHSHPEPIRVWPSDSNDGKENVFIDFCPIRYGEWKIEQGKKYTLSYRMVVFDGKMSVDEAEVFWQEFVKHDAQL